MRQPDLPLAVTCLWAVCTIALAAEPAGPLTSWSSDEGQGVIAHDDSGNRRDAQLHGATWVSQTDGREAAKPVHEKRDEFVIATRSTAALPRFLEIPGPAGQRARV